MTVTALATTTTTPQGRTVPIPCARECGLAGLVESLLDDLGVLGGSGRQWAVEYGRRGAALAGLVDRGRLGSVTIPDSWLGGSGGYNPIGTWLTRLHIPSEFAVLHLSSDRCLEFMAWRNLDAAWRPTVVVARFDHTKPPGVRSAAARASFSTMTELAESKGYAVVGFERPYLAFLLKRHIHGTQERGTRERGHAGKLES